jgi:dTDP-4-dehydrorhamnose reductase
VGHDPVVLVTGGGGQVARALETLIDGRFLAHNVLDVTDQRAVTRAVDGADVVVHLAALTDVDGCERDPEKAHAVNCLGTRNVASASHASGARLIYLSTDYVFDGGKAGEYGEGDRPRPINQYGRSKRDGERHTQDFGGNLIVRTSWVYGEGRNFVRTILEGIRREAPLSVVDDQRGRPTAAADVASALVHLMRRRVSGVVHVAGEGQPCTWADLADHVLASAGASARVERVDSAAFQRRVGKLVAPRPANSALSLDRARGLDVPLRDWRSAVESYVKARM